MRVVIAGAGIGGLCLALSLHAAGVEVEVHEAAPELQPLGVGINLLPNAVRELTELGLGEPLARTGVATSTLVYANRLGQEIWREPRGQAAGYDWPQYAIHRGRLQMLLFEAALARIGPDRFFFDHELARVDSSSTRIVAGFRSRRDGSTRGVATGDVFVACEGVHSVTRAQLNPQEGPPIWNRRVMWRGLTLAPAFLDGATMVAAGHSRLKFVCYPITPADPATGLAQINWIAEVAFPAAPDWRREDWNRVGRAEDVLPHFEGWRLGWLDASGLIRNAGQIYEYPMVDRDPLKLWTHRRITLLGDAAHPMYPTGSNGASQAILDARTLAWHLATEATVDAALAAYEAARRPPTSRIVLANRDHGPDLVLDMAEARAPHGFGDIAEVIDRHTLAAVAADYKRLAGFEPSEVNQRASLSPPAAS